MQRIKTHTPIKLNKKIVPVGKNYICEIIYSQVQLFDYYKYTLTDNWAVIKDEIKYNKELSGGYHYLVFRKDGYRGCPKEMTDGFPLDTYGTSLFLIKQDNNNGSFVSCLTRWNSGGDCGVKTLTDKQKNITFESLKQITELTDKKFNEIYKIWKTVSINFNKNTIDIPVGIKQTYGLNLNQEDLFNNTYVKKVEEENINKIIDYEKRQFVLNYISLIDKNEKNDYVGTWDKQNGTYTIQGDNATGKKNRDDVLHIANTLTFDLYFRKRETIATTKVNGVYYYDYGNWETDDSLYWFQTIIEQGKGSSVSDGGDCLGFLGFTDEDIFYQKDNLKKSFLRLSVYDSPYRQTQKLLYYSTLFFDTNVLYKKYVDYYLAKRGVKSNNNQYVYTSNSGLKASFSCTNKFNQDASSDGFYLYLFDKVVNGNNFTTLYLKVEFNNAKMGKTVPLLWPGESGKKLKDPPVHYMTESSTTGAKVNLKGLLNDLYIPIGVKYNFQTNEFVWFIIAKYYTNISKKRDGNIRLKLFEPRINKTT